MAEKSRIKVAVVEGDYAELCGLGLPLPLSLQLQCLNLSLSKALWSAKASRSGFSVSLYWPTTADTQTLKTVAAKAKKHKRKRRCKQAPGSASNNEKTPETVPCKMTPLNSPINEHHSPDNIVAPALPSDSSPCSGVGQSSDAGLNTTMSDESLTESLDGPVVDLVECSDVQYAMKDGVHGVSYTSHLGEQGWTPVIGRRKKRSIPDYVKRRFPPDHPIHHQDSDAESESDEEALDNAIPTGGKANVDYLVIDNTPGLIVKTRCTRAWTPIAARTRARLKK